MTHRLPSQMTPGPDHRAKRPQPVLDAATAASILTTVVGLILTVLVASGVIGQDDADNLAEAITPAITAVVGAVSTIVAALRARQKVTPLEAPQNTDGTPLMAVPGLSRGPGQ